jgi:aminopeptidase N
VAIQPDALFHALYLSPRRGLDVNPYEAPPTRRTEPLDGPRRPVRDRAFHMEHLKLELDVDVARGRLAGTATLVLRPQSPGLRVIELDAKELTIGTVMLRAARARRLSARHAGARLFVRLDRAYDPGETITLEIAYRARPRTGFWFVRPDAAYPNRRPQAWSQGQAEDSGFWFPCHDHPNDKFTSEIVVTAPVAFRTVSNGRLVRRQRSADGARATWHWKLDRPLPAYLVSLAVAPYVETTANAKGAKLRFYAFDGQERAARRLYGRTADMVSVFTWLFGAYPWGEYSQIVVSEYTWGGMENTGATTLTEKALLDDRAALDVSYEGLISHELAHQWWGDLVTCRGWHHNWLNESWATYCENLYEEAAHGPEAAAWDRVQKTSQYLAQDLGQYRRPIVFDRYHIPMDLFDRHAYEKGSLVLTMLRDELGDDAFFRGARLHLVRHAHGFADTHEFRRAMEDAAGRDLNWFFDQWVFAAGYPELFVTWKAGARGTVTVTVRQKQNTRLKDHEATPLFRVGLDVLVHGTRGATYHRVTVTKKEESFTLPGKGRTLRIAVDPDFRVLKTLALAQAAPAWRHALEHDPSPIERMRAARELAAARGGGRVARAALVGALADDPSPHVRMAAAIALGETSGTGARAEAARTALARAAADGDAHVRRAAAFALGLTGRKAEAALVAVLAREKSYLVKATALKALATIRSAHLWAACAAAMNDRGWRDLVPMAALDALAIARPARAFDVAFASVRYGETQEVREAAVRLLVALAGDPKVRSARREQARHVVPALVALLSDPSVFVQLAAAQGAAKLNDRALLPALRRVVREEAWDHLVRTAEKSVRTLEAKGRKRKSA